MTSKNMVQHFHLIRVSICVDFPMRTNTQWIIILSELSHNGRERERLHSLYKMLPIYGVRYFNDAIVKSLR